MCYFRKLNKNDLLGMIEVEKSAFGCNETEDSNEVFLNRIETFNDGCIGFFDINDILIGYISSEIWDRINKIESNILASKYHNEKGNILYITFLAIKKDFHGKGIGTKLINELIKNTSKYNIERLLLKTFNTKSFYEKFGFNIVKYNDKGNYYIMEFII